MKSPKSTTVTLDDLELTIVRMTPMDGYRLFAKVAPMNAARKSGDMDAAAAALTPELATFALSTVTVTRLDDQLGKLIKIDCTTEDMINRAFTDRLPLLMQAVGKAIEFQLADFSKGSPASVTSAEPATLTPSP